jgi:hypothetical protein
MAAQLLGEVLIQKGVITKQILDKALEAQQNDGGLLGMILLSGGYISEKNLIEALAAPLRESSEPPRYIH